MTCKTASVEEATNKTETARKQIERLQNMLLAKEGSEKAIFYNLIKSHLMDAGVTDATELEYNSYVKIEYTSEFSLDKIVSVVKNALVALSKTYTTAQAPVLSQDVIGAYADLVVSVAEAAKSSSSSSSNYSFSMNRLSTGIYAFLSASSINIKDADTFGTEAITGTTIYYRLMKSIDDIQLDVELNSALIDAKNLLNMKALQAALTDELASEGLNIEEWLKKDEAYSAAVSRLAARLLNRKFKKAQPLMINRVDVFGASSPPIRHSFEKGSEENQNLVRESIKRLATMGSGYELAIKASEERLKNNYF